jgi:hypothetical protein
VVQRRLRAARPALRLPGHPPPADDWLGVRGVVVGPLFLLCSLEFVGANERSGWKPAATLTPITYVAWSVWLLAVGVALLV